MNRIKSLLSMRGVLLGKKIRTQAQGAEELSLIATEAKILLPNAQVASVYCRICYELGKILSITQEKR